MEQLERTEEQRADDRERKRRSRASHAATEQDQEFKELKRRDPEAARIQELWAEVMAKPITRPGVPLPDPGPARLPTLIELRKNLASIHQTEAVREELARVEAAIASGLTEMPGAAIEKFPG